MEAAKKGFSQILWLLGPEHNITEVGTMNLFVLLKDEKGKLQLFTPALDGTILPGITRKSVLELVRGWNEMDVVEGVMSMSELLRGLKEGRVLEVFGTGTAVVVSPVRSVSYGGVDYAIPLDADDPKAGSGPVARRIWKELTDIQYGASAHPWSTIV